MTLRKITMIGAGSPGFSLAVGEDLMQSPILRASRFVLMDIDATRLDASAKRMQELAQQLGSPLQIESTTDRRAALDGAAYVVTSCEAKRAPFWVQDLKIPARYGVHQLTGENGGPGGQIHAMRNITLFMDICRDMRELCPDAWLMNFTNPMSFICTFAHRYGGVKTLGFCHQVHGSFGVIAEMLGYQPGELEVITAGVNHFNWLIDIRRKGSGESCLAWFLDQVRESEHWRGVRSNVPCQHFTRELLDLLGIYPVGYDDHIAEYIPFFYDLEERRQIGYTDHAADLSAWMNDVARHGGGFEAQVKAASEAKVPIPRDAHHPYYREKTCAMMEALETNSPTYTDAINIVNHGCVDNLPADAVVDIPAVAIGGEVRGVHVGPLPRAAAELCRRQITIHELVVEATVHGDRQLALQAMCLDPYVRSLRQARQILDEFLTVYRDYLPQFHRAQSSGPAQAGQIAKDGAGVAAFDEMSLGRTS